MRPVWRNERGGLTFALGGGGERRRFVKWAPAGSGIDFAAEAERLRWAGAFVAVPGVLERGADGEGSWLVSSALAGENAVSPRWVGDPGRAVAAIGRGLRALHDRLPVEACPFSWSVCARLRPLGQPLRARSLDPSDWDPRLTALAPEAVMQRLRDPPPVDRLVVCHGDACAPNTLIAPDGSVAGHVDMGALGVADRWADIAIASWSTEWNYGPGWEQALLDAYGIEPDPERTEYYRLLWDVTP